MSRGGRRGRSRGFTWPGFGLVVGVGVGTIGGLMLVPELFFIGTGAGAGLGLVAGAIIERSIDASM